MIATIHFADLAEWWFHIPTPVALAMVALIGYIFGTRTRQKTLTEASQARREIRRAKLVARELEKIAESIRRDLATHKACVHRFKERLNVLHGSDKDVSWQELCREAEDILRPTLKVAMQISLAYDEIRQQTNQLMTFTEVRTDPLTGVSNRKALDETLENMFALMQRYDRPFSVAIFDIDHFKQINDHQGHLYGDRMLQKFAKLLDDAVRETDVVARYGGEEFVVVMPQTPLAGATIFSERLRAAIEDRLPLTISGGIAEARRDDVASSLLSRADSALYSAKAAGRNAIFSHNGEVIEAAVREDSQVPAALEVVAQSELEHYGDVCDEGESDTQGEIAGFELEKKS